MTLYITDIVGKLLETRDLEHVLEKDTSRTLPAAPSIRERRLSPNRLSVETAARRSFVTESASPSLHKRLSADPSLGSGLSRAFSFRKKPEASQAVANLRPLKLVEEQQPQPPLWTDGSLAPARSRIHNEEGEDAAEIRAAKRASWVPGWFGKGSVPSDDKT
jgi:hypothetical protein